MNYITHLNAFFQYLKKDTRLTASHVSLYMALFQYWNFNRFQNPFAIYRDDIMRLSKIGSKNTYHKCIKELHLARYIYCHTPVSKYQPVKVTIMKLALAKGETNETQLDLFSNGENGKQTGANLPQKGGDLEGATSTDYDTQQCPKIDTEHVSILTATCPNNGTVHVPYWDTL